MKLLIPMPSYGLVKAKTGIDVRVISGETEAELTIKGISWGQEQTVVNPACSLMVDIGGGSTELILNHDANVKFSLPLGAVKLFELFIKHDPPSTQELSLLSAHILAELARSVFDNQKENQLQALCPDSNRRHTCNTCSDPFIDGFI